MITIDPDKSKVLEFKINITGNSSDPVARLVLPISENMNLSIPGEVHNDSIQISVPVLRPFYESLKNGSAQLEVIVDGSVFSPWVDQVEYQEKIKVVAEVVDSAASKSKINIGANLISESNIKTKQKTHGDNDIVDDYI